jgi:basic amino acid/polyamine antiporter, APA family
VRDLPGEAPVITPASHGPRTGGRSEPGRVQPVRHLGLVRLLGVGINGVIGGGIFILPADVAGLVGPASLLSYAAAGAIVFGIGTALARLATRHDVSGGPYAYVASAFGPFAGFQVGWLFCLARLTALANLLNGAARYIGALLPALARPVPRALVILACAAIITGILLSGIRRTSMATGVLAVLKVAPLVALGLLGLLLLDPARLHPGPVEPGSFLRSVLLLIYAFTGFEILTVPAEESLQPRRDVPAALRATLFTVSAIYILVQVAALGALPDLAGEKAPLAALAALVAGEPARIVMTLVATLSMAGCGLASLLGASRMTYSLSAAGQIPAFLGALEPRRRTPATAALLFGALGAVLAIAGGYAFLAAVSAGSRLLIYLACCGAAMKRVPAGTADADRAAIGGAPVAPDRGIVAPLVTAVAIVALLFQLEPDEVSFGMIGVGAGLGLYGLARWRRLAVSTKEAS